VLELLEDDTSYYVVMELISDGTLLDFLNERVRQKKPLSEREMASFCNQIVLALTYMHG
jgi:serine/threonine protein kinase